MKKFVVLSLLFCLTFLHYLQGYSQDWKSDSTWADTKKNIVRYNISQPVLVGFENAIIFGYERMLKPNRSISVNLGAMSLPKFGAIVTEDFEMTKNLSNEGINFSVDYRFYLDKLNKFNGPRGVYIGPYYSFNNWKRKNSWDYLGAGEVEKTAKTDAILNINMVGFELGYQFIFWDRLAIDLVLIGPGVGWYALDAKASGTGLTEEEKEKLQEAILEVIEEKFPGLDYSLDDDKLESDGTLRQTTLGFRYLIHIGYTFDF